MTLANIIPLLISTAIPLIFFGVISGLDLYRTGSFKLILMSFGWGIVAYLAATLVNPAARDFINMRTDTFVGTTEMVRYIAPITEEILKSAFLVYLIRRKDFTYFVDGAIYGFAIGIGFAIVENYAYVAFSPSSAVPRVLSTNLMHATASSVVGIALGFANFRKISSGIWMMLSGLVLGMAIHAGFNNLVDRVNTGYLLLYAMTAGFVGVGFVVFAIQRGLKEAKSWIEEKLGDADRVTKGEAAVVNRMEDLDELLEPLEEIFGEEKLTEIKRFLLLQAQLGILRGTLEKHSTEQKKEEVRERIDEVRAEMDEARRAVGTYGMLYVRQIFPPDTSPLWNQLDNVIEQRAATVDRSGPSVFDRIGQAAAARTENDDDIE